MMGIQHLLPLFHLYFDNENVVFVHIEKVVTMEERCNLVSGNFTSAKLQTVQVFSKFLREALGGHETLTVLIELVKNFKIFLMIQFCTGVDLQGIIWEIVKIFSHRNI